MTRPRLLLLLGLVLALFNLNAVAAGYPLIVQISPTTSITAVASYLGGTVVDSIPEFNEYLLQVPVVPIVQTLPLLGIDWMELNSGVTLPPLPHLMYLQVAPNAAADWYKAQPALVLINAGKALAYSTGRGVVVADINSQVDYSHPALRGHLTSGYDFVTSKPSGATALNQSSASYLDQSSASYLDQSSASYLDQSSASYLDQSSASYLDGLNPAYSHGTLCAGIIAVVAPDAMIMPLRTFDDNGSSDLFMIGKAIRYAVKLGAQVINMSFGTITDSQAISSAVAYAQRENAALAASAGNNNTSNPQYPAAYSGVATTAATDIQDVKASFSNYGKPVYVDAPGVNIISAFPGNLYAVVNGTSFSAPTIAGTAALLRSQESTGVVSRVAAGAINIDVKNPNYANQLGYGRIDILKSVTSK